MGNTKVICTVTGPAETSGAAGRRTAGDAEASVQVEVNVAGFSGVERKRRARGDKSVFCFCLFFSGGLGYGDGWVGLGGWGWVGLR